MQCFEKQFWFLGVYLFFPLLRSPPPHPPPPDFLLQTLICALLLREFGKLSCVQVIFSSFVSLYIHMYRAHVRVHICVCGVCGWFGFLVFWVF